MSVENNNEDRLRRREVAMMQSQKQVVATLKSIETDICTIKTVIVGDPLKPENPGVVMRLDRLENSERIRSKILWTVGTGFIGLLLDRLRTML